MAHNSIPEILHVWDTKMKSDHLLNNVSISAKSLVGFSASQMRTTMIIILIEANI